MKSITIAVAVLGLAFVGHARAASLSPDPGRTRVALGQLGAQTAPARREAGPADGRAQPDVRPCTAFRESPMAARCGAALFPWRAVGEIRRV
jgi:hypothetical protein